MLFRSLTNGNISNTSNVKSTPLVLLASNINSVDIFNFRSNNLFKIWNKNSISIGAGVQGTYPFYVPIGAKKVSISFSFNTSVGNEQLLIERFTTERESFVAVGLETIVGVTLSSSDSFLIYEFDCSDYDGINIAITTDAADSGFSFSYMVNFSS